MSDSLEQRVAKLEARMDKDDDDRKERREELDKKLDSINTSLKSIVQEMNRYKGFVGGVSLMISLAWAGVAFFKDALVELLRR